MSKKKFKIATQATLTACMLSLALSSASAEGISCEQTLDTRSRYDQYWASPTHYSFVHSIQDHRTNESRRRKGLPPIRVDNTPTKVRSEITPAAVTASLIREVSRDLSFKNQDMIHTLAFIYRLLDQDAKAQIPHEQAYNQQLAVTLFNLIDPQVSEHDVRIHKKLNPYKPVSDFEMALQAAQFRQRHFLSALGLLPPRPAPHTPIWKNTGDDYKELLSFLGIQATEVKPTDLPTGQQIFLAVEPNGRVVIGTNVVQDPVYGKMASVWHINQMTVLDLHDTTYDLVSGSQVFVISRPQSSNP